MSRLLVLLVLLAVASALPLRDSSDTKEAELMTLKAIAHKLPALKKNFETAKPSLGLIRNRRSDELSETMKKATEGTDAAKGAAEAAKAAAETVTSQVTEKVTEMMEKLPSIPGLPSIGK